MKWVRHVACFREKNNVYWVLVENLKERDHHEDQGMDGRGTHFC
jgi:hypothetical protein